MTAKSIALELYAMKGCETMNITKKIEDEAKRIEAMHAYLNRSKESRERSARPLIEFPSMGLLMLLKKKEVKP